MFRNRREGWTGSEVWKGIEALGKVTNLEVNLALFPFLIRSLDRIDDGNAMDFFLFWILARCLIRFWEILTWVIALPRMLITGRCLN